MLSEQAVQGFVFQETVARGRPPKSADVAAAFGSTAEEALEAFRQLRARKLVALASDSGEISMAPPFSATPTPYRVTVGSRSYFANCVWDSYGIPAALHEDAEIEASCGCCGEPMALAVRGGRAVAVPGVAHFAVPAAQWWDDVAYT